MKTDDRGRRTHRDREQRIPRDVMIEMRGVSFHHYLKRRYRIALRRGRTCKNDNGLSFVSTSARASARSRHGIPPVGIMRVSDMYA